VPHGVPIEDQAMSLLPVFLKLEGRRGLLVGAGAVALEKIGSLLKTGLRLRVVAPMHLKFAARNRRQSRMDSAAL
jgi:siroheme synthase (precorrin-2 oxidase/ferrochelatase)